MTFAIYCRHSLLSDFYLNTVVIGSCYCFKHNDFVGLLVTISLHVEAGLIRTALGEATQKYADVTGDS